jgi:hypothetical protein
MPSFYETTEDGTPAGGPDDVLDGNNLEQIQALRDYIMVLKQADQLLAGEKKDDTQDAPADAAAPRQDAAAEPAGEASPS